MKPYFSTSGELDPASFSINPHSTNPNKWFVHLSTTTYFGASTADLRKLHSLIGEALDSREAR